MSILKIPTSINNGDSYTWSDTLSDYPASDYTLSWAIRGESSLTLTATAAVVVGQGEETSPSPTNDYTTAITSSQSSLLTPGSYYWQAVVAKDSNRITVGSGSLDVIRDLFATGSGYDGRTEAQKLLDAVSEAIVTITNGGVVQSYSIKGRTLSKYTLTELIQLRDRARAEVAREQARASGQDRRVYIQFDRG